MWINEQAFFERTLRNDLVSLRLSRESTLALNIKLVEHGRAPIDISPIDAAIQSTEALLASGSHHS
jgi:hypothetical protein